MEDADLDVRLVGPQARRGEVEQRENVLGGEVLDPLDDRREAAVARMLRGGEVVEELGKLAEEAIGVHGRRGRGKRRPYRWLVTPARSDSSDGGSYQDRA